MPQVSKYPLTKTTEQRLYKLFWETIANFKDSYKAEQFFNDLLTPTEKIMLSKRLAIAIMLLKEYDYSAIRSVLKVSPGTIGSVSLWLKHSGTGYRKALEKLARREKLEDILETVDATLELITPQKTFGRALAKGGLRDKFKEPF